MPTPPADLEQSPPSLSIYILGVLPHQVEKSRTKPRCTDLEAPDHASGSQSQSGGQKKRLCPDQTGRFTSACTSSTVAYGGWHGHALIGATELGHVWCGNHDFCGEQRNTNTMMHFCKRFCTVECVATPDRLHAFPVILVTSPASP